MKMILLTTIVLLTIVNSTIYAQNDTPILSDTTSKHDVAGPFLSRAENDIKKMIDYGNKKIYYHN